MKPNLTCESVASARVPSPMRGYTAFCHRLYRKVERAMKGAAWRFTNFFLTLKLSAPFTAAGLHDARRMRTEPPHSQ
jgi:hypothetical protein